LETATPTSPQEFQDSVGLFQTQLTILREQALRAIIEGDNLSETCAHTPHKSTLVGHDGFRLTKKLDNLGYFYHSLKNTEIISCDRCLEKRQDSVFMWTGSEINSLTDLMEGERQENISELLKRKLSRVHPLAIQSVWTSILNLKYDRNFESTLERKRVDHRRVPDTQRPGKSVKVLLKSKT